jgi:hypothetical protein
MSSELTKQSIGGFEIADVASNVAHFDFDFDFDFDSNTYPSTCFLFNGSVRVLASNGQWDVIEGFYFSILGRFSTRGSGKVVLFRWIVFKGQFLIGGPLESCDRVAYINNCSELSPRQGDPRMNCLQFPRDTQQAIHAHQTMRFAIVANGVKLVTLPRAVFSRRRE